MMGRVVPAASKATCHDRVTLPVGAEAVERGEVAVGEGDVEAGHPFAVVEEPGGDPVADPGRDRAVHRGEVPDATALLEGAGDDRVERLQDVLDGLDVAAVRRHHPSLPRSLVAMSVRTVECEDRRPWSSWPG